MKRRNFLKWLFPATVAAAIPPPSDANSAESALVLAQRCADALANEKGGKWVVMNFNGDAITIIKA